MKTNILTQKKQVLCDLRVLFGLFSCQTPDNNTCGLIRYDHRVQPTANKKEKTGVDFFTKRC